MPKHLVAPGYNKSPHDNSLAIRNRHASEFKEEGREFGSSFWEFMRPEQVPTRGQHPCHDMQINLAVKPGRSR